jgi:hypothetical protein
MAPQNHDHAEAVRCGYPGIVRSAFVLTFVMLFTFVLQAQNPATFTLQVDARNNCVSMFQSANHNYSPVSHPIDNGAYQVTVVSNVTYHPGCCHVGKVALYATTDDQPDGWFHVVSDQSPIYLKVTGQGTDANTVYAYFADGDCGDNQGTATVYFRKLTAMPPVCSGKDCN